MATHSSTLVWKIPWTEEPGRLQSMGSRRVGHDWVTSLSLFTLMHWRRDQQHTPVFLPGESQGRRSLVGCCLGGHTGSDTTEATQQQQQQPHNYFPQIEQLLRHVWRKEKLWTHKCGKHLKPCNFGFFLYFRSTQSLQYDNICQVSVSKRDVQKALCSEIV